MKRVLTQVNCPFCDASYSLLVTKPRPGQDSPFELNCTRCESEFQGWAKKIMGRPKTVEFNFVLTHRGAKLKELLAEREKNAQGT